LRLLFPVERLYVLILNFGLAAWAFLPSASC
jgi:hypothetical protein